MDLIEILGNLHQHPDMDKTTGREAVERLAALAQEKDVTPPGRQYLLTQASVIAAQAGMTPEELQLQVEYGRLHHTAKRN